MPDVNVQRLYSENRERLNLNWIAGKHGGLRTVPLGSLYNPQVGMISHLNLTHPHRFQVIGEMELAFLRGLDGEALEAALDVLFSDHLVAIITADGQTAHGRIIECCERLSIPLLASPRPGANLIDVLRHFLSLELAEMITLHGVYLVVLEVGVLITGSSAVGKSELALELISRGHGLVADDVVELYHIGPTTLQGRCPPLLRDFLEVRGLGVINIRSIFGETAVRPRKTLKLIVHLEKPGQGDLATMERLPMNSSTQTILGIEYPKVVLPVAEGRNLAVLVEAATRNFILRSRGIDSTRQFMERHERLMAQEAGEGLEDDSFE